MGSPASNGAKRGLVLVAGASGYVGGRLVPELLSRGYAVRCVVRDPRKLDVAPWRTQVEVRRADIANDLHDEMANVDVAVFLVHSIGEGKDWVDRERAIAENFRRAAEIAGVGRIVYMGGLGDEHAALSDHLRSRHEVGRVLAAGPIPTVEVRAAVVIGSGSASFEMLRYLTEVLPVMVTPKWVTTLCQPISIRDVMHYLGAVIEAPEPLTGVLEIGGPDVVSYAEMMAIYAREAGLTKRRLIPVPVLSPRLSSLWVGLVTPVPAQLARPLVDSLVNAVVVTNDRAETLFPFERVPLAEAIHQAIGRTAKGDVPTRFNDASPVWQPTATDAPWTGGTELTDVRRIEVAASVHDTWLALCRIGGERGWYSGSLLWKARGLLDLVVGGPGLRPGRRHPDRLSVGEPLDFWRVEDLEPDRRLVLHAEMLLPGEAWLEWSLEPNGDSTQLVQTARFRPRGLLGRAYWYGVAPFHRLVFPGLINGIANDAVQLRTLATP
ncbi:MAG: hypothetical protein JWL70_441 [Acidimicrobiia bacterium]|nr:hypothetical protein [Acidimicrobiia bacterium]